MVLIGNLKTFMGVDKTCVAGVGGLGEVGG